ncbi:MAG: hypothetical protein QOD05_1914 [Microbacteriaceae bacterium]|nr:hypothetical protein [Microbacteriaceae bacterium]
MFARSTLIWIVRRRPQNGWCRYSQAIPSPSRSSLREYPGSPTRMGVAPAARAAAQFGRHPRDSVTSLTNRPASVFSADLLGRPEPTLVRAVMGHDGRDCLRRLGGDDN